METKSKLQKEIDAILREKGLTNLNYNIIKVDEIPIDPETGKSPIVEKV